MMCKKLILAVGIFTLLTSSGCGRKNDPQAEKKTEDKHEEEKEGGQKQEDEKKGGQKQAEEKGRIKLSPEALKNAGIKTAPAKSQALTDTIQVTANIAHNQDRLFHVTPRITGRVVDVKVSLGNDVQVGTVLAVLDSVELGQTKSEYLKSQTLLELTRHDHHHRLPADPDPSGRRKRSDGALRGRL